MRITRWPNDAHGAAPDRYPNASHRPPDCATHERSARLDRERPGGSELATDWLESLGGIPLIARPLARTRASR
jgi:hypothetical protein